MSLLFIGSFVGGAWIMAAWAYTRWGRPLRSLRAMVAALANDEELPEGWVGRETERSLRLIADRSREQTGRESEALFNLHAVLNSLGEGVLIIDGEEKIRLANPGFERLLGLSNPALNRSLLEVVREPAVRDATRRTLATGEAQTLVAAVTVRQPDGKYAPQHFQWTTAPLIPHGSTKPAAVIAILYDITQLTHLEKVRRDFVANISHELRTPLSIINGYLETLLEPGGEADPKTAHRFHEVMWKHGQRLKLLLDDLLTLARLESPEGAGEMRFAPVDLRACLNGVVDRLEPVLANQNVALRMDLPAKLPAIEGDADRLDQVFFNLLDNTLKHARPPQRVVQEKKLEIVIRGGMDGSAGPQIDLEFIDNGAGIPLADQPHVFERFYRAHQDRSRQTGGTGLGLSIVKHIVKAHGGQVSVESAPGNGATFHLRLPIRQRQPDAPAPAGTLSV